MGDDGGLGEFWVGVGITHAHTCKPSHMTNSLTHAHAHTLGWGASLHARKPASTEQGYGSEPGWEYAGKMIQHHGRS